MPAGSEGVAGKLAQPDLLFEDAALHGVRDAPKEREDRTLLGAMLSDLHLLRGRDVLAAVSLVRQAKDLT